MDCGIRPMHDAILEFESGISVKGVVESLYTGDDGGLLIISFSNCTVKEKNGNILFKPEWGEYDMVVGERIVSVFNGAADKDSYEEITQVSKQHTVKVDYDEVTLKLHEIYRTVRAIREGSESEALLDELFRQLKTEHRTDWLSSLEILEILNHKDIYPELKKEIRVYLEMKASNEKEHTKLINDGLHVIANPVSQLITDKDE